MTIITRFAPSPTGDLHVGSVRTALYSWLYAKNKGGKFILRIEDTDRVRSTKEAIDVILDGMKWLGLTWDQGPIYQTQRFDRYDEVINILLDKGLAYKCYCSKERVDQLREQQLAKKEKPRYDGHCRNLKKHEKSENKDNSKPYVIRFKNPIDGVVEFEDAIRGHVVVQNSELDDLIIKRTDGYPTYNFTVVVDDMDMQITDVIRGEDHITNTPRQVNIFKALEVKPPRFAHMPNILGSDGKKLSKRHGAVSVLQYKNEGYLPEALLNYLVRLGWSYGDQEIFSIEEMIKLFSFNNVSKSPAAFNNEKLDWLNQHYLKTLPIEYICKNLIWHYDKNNIDYTDGPSVEKVVLALRERCKTLVEMLTKSSYIYQKEIQINEDAARKHLTANILEPFKVVLDSFKTIDEWNVENIKNVISKVVKDFELKMPQIAQPLRVAITGDTMSPSIDITLELIGKEKVINRMEYVINSQYFLL